VLIGNFVRPEVLPLGLLDPSVPEGGSAFTHWLNLQWQKAFSQFPSVRLLDVAGIVEQHGRKQANDPIRWYRRRIPFTESTLHLLGRHIARFASAWLLPPKVIVFDCDGILWAANGEKRGYGKLLEDDSPISAYGDFQLYLLALKQRGFPLVLCSNSSEKDIWTAFAQQPGMILRRKHLAAWKINSRRKSENLGEIAAELNVDMSRLVMISADPMECAEMHAELPEMELLQLPGNAPGTFINVVEDSGLFDVVSVKAEDVNENRWRRSLGYLNTAPACVSARKA
jgi:predicted enzyme involved in methoxymalonyl-ACP biosynthesis